MSDEWKWISARDVGRGQFAVCKECNRETVRFLHTLHNVKRGSIEVGVKCAERLCKDVVNISRHDLEARSKAARKDYFDRQPWYAGPANDLKKQFRQRVVRVYQDDAQKWRIKVDEMLSKDEFSTKLEAKNNAFEYVNQVYNYKHI